MKKEDIVNTINEQYRDYEGYVQFSHRAIDKERDIFYDGKRVEVLDENGFIYEAHFYNEKESISIKQINDSWLVSTTDISNVDENDTEKFISDVTGWNYKIKMAQIWEKEADEFCEGIEMKKLKKVVFAGFIGGES